MLKSHPPFNMGSLNNIIRGTPIRRDVINGGTPIGRDVITVGTPIGRDVITGVHP